MNDYLHNATTWGDLIKAIIVLGVVFVLLQVIWQTLSRRQAPGGVMLTMKEVAYRILLLFEPLAMILLVSIFVLIYPALHGLLAAALFISLYNPIRSYISGRIMRWNETFKEGNRLKTKDTEGVIYDIHRLGLWLKTRKGQHFVGYSKLISEGYTLITGEEIGGYYRLNIQKDLEIENEYSKIDFIDLMSSAPYLDKNHKPEIALVNDIKREFDVRVLVKEESHLHDLAKLIREWGYHCKIVKK